MRKEWCWRDSQPSVWAAAKLGRRRSRRKENLIWDPTKADKILLAISNGDRILLSVRNSISFNLKSFVQHSLLTKMITAWPLSNNSAFIWKFRLTATMIDFKKECILHWLFEFNEGNAQYDKLAFCSTKLYCKLLAEGLYVKAINWECTRVYLHFQWTFSSIRAWNN